MAMHTVMIYARFERFWHWTQALLILVLLASGFAVRGLHEGLSFQLAVTVHSIAALCLIALWLLAVFWHFTTGAWRHYVPTREGLGQVARYYLIGIFRGERHPYRRAFWRKHNPLQALTYAALKLVLFPAVGVTGLAYLGYAAWESGPTSTAWLAGIAQIHVLAAYAILAFIIAHVYLLTTGGRFVDHVAPMITGYDAVDLTEAEAAYLAEEPRHRMRE